jgi:hypothetical protein
MSQHPYKLLPETAFWRKSVATPHFSDVDPVGRFDLTITPNTRVATAGSCFAQHIARHLQQTGFHYYVAEKGHPIVPEKILKEHNYGTFSARYGNLYTARQLVQLFKRAHNTFSPVEDVWAHEDGSLRDPFRPNVQPGGYITKQEVIADREQHLAYVKTMFEKMDVFVFTLGLTECWRSKIDGAVFPLCPGVEGGEFSHELYEFYNQTVFDVITDMNEFIHLLKEVNPNAQIILTVSPVPLMATAEPDAHVLSATTYSKSVLRVAAETLSKQHAHAHYFPSYEIITGAFNRGRYFADDLRNVLEEGVNHVMGLFLKHVAGIEVGQATKHTAISEKGDASDDFLKQAQHLVEVECDEELLDNTNK